MFPTIDQLFALHVMCRSMSTDPQIVCLLYLIKRLQSLKERKAMNKNYVSMYDTMIGHCLVCV